MQAYDRDDPPAAAERPFASRTSYASSPTAQTPTAAITQTQTVVIMKRKSKALAFLLTLLFGPLGMLYSTVIGALIMLVVSVALAAVTAGISLLLTHPICIIWGVLAAD